MITSLGFSEPLKLSYPSLLTVMVDLQDHYSVLQVSPKATPADIKRAFRKLARQYHPDLNPNDPKASAAFQEICAAYQVLSRHKQRELYDRNRNIGSQSIGPGKPAAVVLKDAHQFCRRGTRKAHQRNYAAAIADFTRAIYLDDSYIEAYMGRAQARFFLGHYQDVLVDCDSILSLQPNSTQAYFFRGRCHYRLGQFEQAIDSYTEAIAINNKFAQAYFYRGVAYLKVRKRQSIQDLTRAAHYFRQQGQISQYQRAIATLKDLNRTPLHRVLNLPRNIALLITTALTSLPRLFIHPCSGTSQVWRKQLPSQLLGISVVFSTLAIAGVVGGFHRFSPLPLSYLQLIILSLTALSSLVLTSGIIRQMVGKGGSWSGDFWVASVAALPLGGWAILSGWAIQLGLIEFIALSLLASNYAILSLYGGYTQIGQIPESIASVSIPTILMISYGVTALIYQILPV